MSLRTYSGSTPAGHNRLITGQYAQARAGQLGSFDEFA